MKSQLIALARGTFTAPVFCALDRLGYRERMRQGPFTVQDFPDADAAALNAVLHYLEGIGILLRDGEQYRTTEFGAYAFERDGLFQLLQSYRDYFEHLDELLTDPQASRRVRRGENIDGSARLHSRKYYRRTLAHLQGQDFEFLCDVGCGTGEFLAAALQQHASARGFGFDLAPEAVTAARNRFPGDRVSVDLADAAKPDDWATRLPAGRGLIALWFVLHEFSTGDENRIVEFFRDLHRLQPRSLVLIGEIVALPPDALAVARDSSIYPEILLLHALSGQGVLAWEQHRRWLSQVPYRVAAEDRYDEIATAAGPLPSTVVWLLEPAAT